jgi:hypothetical protein
MQRLKWLRESKFGHQKLLQPGGSSIFFAVKQLALLRKQCSGCMCHCHLVLVQARLGSVLSTMWRLTPATTLHRVGHVQKQDWATPSRSLDFQEFQTPAASPPLFHLLVCKSRHDASSHAPESFCSPPPDILAHQCQHYAPSILLAKYKVP